MEKASKVLLVVIGIFFGILGIYGMLFPTAATSFFLAMLNILLYVILTSVIESRITIVIGNLFILSIIFAIAELILGFALLTATNFILIKVSAFLTVLALVLFALIYIYDLIGNILRSIEIRLKK